MVKDLATDGAPGPSPRRPGRPRHVEVSDVVDAALEIGLRGITLAAIADQLEVGQATVYRSVNGLDALRHLVLARAVSEAPWPSGDTPWQETLRQLAAGVASVLDAHPGIAEFCEPVAFEHPNLLEVFALSVGSLVRDGFSTREAVIAVDIVMHLAFDTASENSERQSDESAEARLHALAHSLPAEIAFAARGLAETWTRTDALRVKMAIVIAGIEDLRSSGAGLE